MKRVFVSQQTLRRSPGTGEMVQFPSTNKAAAFGEIVFLVDWYAEKDMTDDQLLWEMRRRLADFSDHDYILPLGSNRSQALAVLVASEVNDGRIKLLEWERDRSGYIVRTLNLQSQPVNAT